MANHKATKKSSRKNEQRKLHNRYYKKTARNAVKQIIDKETDVQACEQSIPKVVSLVDKLARKNVIHKNKAANIKRKLAKKLNALKSPAAPAVEAPTKAKKSTTRKTASAKKTGTAKASKK